VGGVSEAHRKELFPNIKNRLLSYYFLTKIITQKFTMKQIKEKKQHENK